MFTHPGLKAWDGPRGAQKAVRWTPGRPPTLWDLGSAPRAGG